MPELTNEGIPFVIAEDESNISNNWYEAYPLSNSFFSDPKPQNATTFADLCALAKAQSNWSINSKIETRYRSRKLNSQSISLLLSTTRLLQLTTGFNALINAAYIQLLLLDEKDDETVFWKVFLNYAERIKRRDFEKAEEETVKLFFRLTQKKP